MLALMEEADLVLAVTTADLPALGSLKRLLPILARLGGKGSGRLRVVLNRYQPDGTVTLDDIRTLLEMHVHWTLSNDYHALIRAANEGRPIALNGSSPYTRDIGRIVAEIEGEKAAAAPVPARSGALLRLFGRRRQD
jgi:Flp pilus assembly CpaE family ATPase